MNANNTVSGTGACVARGDNFMAYAKLPPMGEPRISPALSKLNDVDTDLNALNIAYCELEETLQPITSAPKPVEPCGAAECCEADGTTSQLNRQISQISARIRDVTNKLRELNRNLEV